MVAWFEGVDDYDLFLSVITVAELEYGIALLPKGKKRDHLEAWLAADLGARFEGRVLDVIPAIAREWGLLTADLHRHGMPIDAMDAFLAATARVHDLTLVTRNDTDFRGTGVKVLNPWIDETDGRPER